MASAIRFCLSCLKPIQTAKFLLGSVLLGVFLSGCAVFSPPSGNNLSAQQPDCCGERASLQRQVNQQQRQIEELSSQLAVLRGFDQAGQRRLVMVSRIGLGRYTRGRDDDQNGIDEGVTIYLVPRDEQGDVIKAYGQVEIELFDLAASDQERDIGSWRFSAEQVAQHWLGGFGTNHFKFDLDWPDGRFPQHNELTVVVRWQDALTGRSFDTQKVIPINIPIP